MYLDQSIGMKKRADRGFGEPIEAQREAREMGQGYDPDSSILKADMQKIPVSSTDGLVWKKTCRKQLHIQRHNQVMQNMFWNITLFSNVFGAC